MRVPRGREEENRQIIGEEAPVTELSTRGTKNNYGAKIMLVDEETKQKRILCHIVLRYEEDPKITPYRKYSGVAWSILGFLHQCYQQSFLALPFSF